MKSFALYMMLQSRDVQVPVIIKDLTEETCAQEKKYAEDLAKQLGDIEITAECRSE